MRLFKLSNVTVLTLVTVCIVFTFIGLKINDRTIKVHQGAERIAIIDIINK